MKVFSQLEKAQLENTTSDTGSLPKGMITYRTDLNIAKVSNGTSMLALIDESSTQTLSGKTYATPSFTGAFNMAQAATPSNPSAGNNKFYFKADGKLYTLDSSGNEAQVGSGSGGGVKNLITNGSADDTASSIFTPYQDSSGTRPADGTGGTTTGITTSITSSSPLDGTKAFLLTKDAANRQGGGWAVSSFTVDPAYRAKSLKISVDYIINSGTFVAGSTGVESDVIWYIYDITNSQLIEPSNIKMFSNNSSIADKFEATFQSSATGASYRLIAHIASTSALAYELKVDNVTVSPQSYVFGTPVTDWVSFTPTGSWVSNATYAGRYRRVGDNLECEVTVSVTGAVTATALDINLPSGLTIDTTKLTSTVDDYTIVGVLAALDSGTGSFSGGVAYRTTTSVRLKHTDTAQPVGTSWRNIDNATPITWANNDRIYARFTVPIVGWSSSVQTSDSADTRAIFAHYATNSQSLTGSDAVNVINWGTKFQDTHNAVTTGAGWKFTAPVPGFYKLACYFNIASVSAGVRVIATLRKNGSNYQRLTAFRNNTGGAATIPNIPMSMGLFLNAGEYIDVTAVYDEATGRSLEASQDVNWFTIEKVNGPAAIAASESVYAAYSTAAGQAVPNTTDTIVNFGTKDFDSHGAVTTGASWKFTAPIAGTYLVSAVTTLGYTASSAVTAESIAYVYRNGTTGYVLGIRNHDVSNNSMAGMQGAQLVKMNAGDYVDVRIYQNNGGSKNLEANAGKNRISIVRVGN